MKMSFYKILLILSIGLNLVLLEIIVVTRNNRLDTTNRSVITPTIQYPDSNKLFELVQNWRISQNKPQYIEDEFLCAYGEFRLFQLKSDWSHNGFSKTSDFIFDNKSFNEIGENLAKDYRLEDDVLAGWLNSPSHKKNLESPFTHTCIRCSESYCIQLFGRN